MIDTAILELLYMWLHVNIFKQNVITFIASSKPKAQVVDHYHQQRVLMVAKLQF